MVQNKTPELGDDVTHITGEETGTVVAKYPRESVPGKVIIMMLDVRVGDNIRYATPMKNWKVIMKEEDMM